MKQPAIHPIRWKLVYAWIVVFTCLTFYGLRSNRDLAAKGAKTHAAVCSFREDLHQRIKDTQTFLLNHPHGIPGLATRSDILTSLANQQATYHSLNGLDC